LYGQICDEWGLQINISQTKSLVFNNTGRTTSHKFYINNTPIENCRNYVYLGVTFSISGSFTEAKNNLYHKGNFCAGKEPQISLP
jgi:hypothetical protein